MSKPKSKSKAKAKPEKRPRLPLSGLFGPGDPGGKTLAAIRRYVESGADVNEEIISSVVNCETLLHLAATHHHVDIMRYLIEQGADVNAVNGEGLTPLAVAAGFTDEPAAVALLLEHGAEVDGRGHADETALQVASTTGNPQIVELLLQRGAELRDAKAICDAQLARPELAHSHAEYQQVKRVIEAHESKR